MCLFIWALHAGFVRVRQKVNKNLFFRKQVLLSLMDLDIGKREGDLCTSGDHLILELGLGKQIALCGSIEARDAIEGQQFISYESNLRLRYATSFSSTLKNRGFRMRYAFVDRESKINTVLQLASSGIGKITSLNYPHDSPSESDIYLKATIGSTIEMRLPRASTALMIYEGERRCNFGDQLVLTVMDAFGDVLLSPPSPNVWSICRHSSVRPRSSSISSSAHHHHAPHFKPLKSIFHVLNIKSAPSKNNTFLFYYKTHKGILCDSLLLFLEANN